jgi:hypothetical protein
MMPTEERVLHAAVLNEQMARTTREIDRRSTTQQALQAVAITSVTAVVGVVLSGHSSPFLLLVVPFLTTLLGMQWLDNHKCIQSLGGYLAQHIEGQATHLLVPPPKFTLWETYIRQGQRDTRLQRWLWVAPVLALFAGSALVILGCVFTSAMVHPSNTSHPGIAPGGIEVWPRLVWILGLGCVAVFLVACWVELRPASSPEGRVAFPAVRTAFEPATRVRLNWDLLERQLTALRVDVLTNVAEAMGWLTTWYVDAATGREVEFGDATRRPLTVSEACNELDSLRPHRRQLVTELSRQTAAEWSSPTLILTYRADAHRVVLDGNHRLVAAAMSTSPPTMVVVTMEGPASPEILADLGRLGYS